MYQEKYRFAWNSFQGIRRVHLHCVSSIWFHPAFSMYRRATFFSSIETTNSIIRWTTAPHFPCMGKLILSLSTLTEQNSPFPVNKQSTFRNVKYFNQVWRIKLDTTLFDQYEPFILYERTSLHVLVLTI